jgi:hypothetical protein
MTDLSRQGASELAVDTCRSRQTALLSKTAVISLSPFSYLWSKVVVSEKSNSVIAIMLDH